MKKIFSISMIKNEADVIESFVRYHLNLFDGMVILDNGSTDNTVPIIKSLAAEGIPLFLIRDSSIEYTQSLKTTKLLYYTFLEYEPDLIFPLDADEFIISSGAGVHPRTLLNELAKNKFYYCQNREYIPHSSNNCKELFIPRRIVHCSDDDNWFKVAVTKEIASRHLPIITKGNHDLLFNSPFKEVIEHEVIAGLRIAHFSIRSIEQAKSKIVVGWLNSLTRFNRKAGEGSHWEWWFNQLKENQDISFHEFISHYFDGYPGKLNPIDLTFCHSLDLKYSKINEVNAIKNLLEFSEALAFEFACLKGNSGKKL